MVSVVVGEAVVKSNVVFEVDPEKENEFKSNLCFSPEGSPCDEPGVASIMTAKATQAPAIASAMATPRPKQTSVEVDIVETAAVSLAEAEAAEDQKEVPARNPGVDGVMVC